MLEVHLHTRTHTYMFNIELGIDYSLRATRRADIQKDTRARSTPTLTLPFPFQPSTRPTDSFV